MIQKNIKENIFTYRMFTPMLSPMSVFLTIYNFLFKKTPNIHTIIKNIKYECENTSPACLVSYIFVIQIEKSICRHSLVYSILLLVYYSGISIETALRSLAFKDSWELYL